MSAQQCPQYSAPTLCEPIIPRNRSSSVAHLQSPRIRTNPHCRARSSSSSTVAHPQQALNGKQLSCAEMQNTQPNFPHPIMQTFFAPPAPKFPPQNTSNLLTLMKLSKCGTNMDSIFPNRMEDLQANAANASAIHYSTLSIGSDVFKENRLRRYTHAGNVLYSSLCFITYIFQMLQISYHSQF